jgi:hypothetical protein
MASRADRGQKKGLPVRQPITPSQRIKRELNHNGAASSQEGRALQPMGNRIEKSTQAILTWINGS